MQLNIAIVAEISYAKAMKYFFILGKNPTLSLAELVSVFSLKQEDILFLSKEAVTVNMDEDLKMDILIKKLGGTIKAGVINDQSSIINFQSIFNNLIFNNAKNEGKFNFGISFYGKCDINEKELAMEIKKELKNNNISSRWVSSKEKQLSSVVVEQNKLTTDKGIEMVIIKNDKGFYIGKTLAVQPFKELSRRDYGRPGRDDASGMLPPKLAQILINLSGAKINHKILDPFCGSGTILTEAALIGYKNLIGSDKSKKAVDDTKKNIKWIEEKYQILDTKYQILNCDVSQLSKNIKPNSIDAIVTEPYLGPQRKKFTSHNLPGITCDLEQLYHQAVLQFDRVLKPTGRVVMVWPVFKIGKDEVYLNTKNILKNSSFQKVNILQDFKFKDIIKLTNRQTMIYGREGQKVWREVIILEKL